MKKLTFRPYVLGVTGSASSGKDSVANYLVKKYNFKKITLSNYLRQEAIKRGKNCSRKSLRKLQAQLRKEYGDEYLISKIINTILVKDHLRMKNVVIVGLRTQAETKLAKEKLKLKLIFVDAGPFIRYKRAKSRRRGGFAKTYEQFLHEEALENAIFDFHKTKKMANFKVDNSGTIKDMQRQINKITKKLKLKKRK
ncbi:MAG: AAA family ATPase [Candidatus Pacearchaeota archaeon]|nr:MAG: AAA family ATPase [Candidatus Pacearchaeota archaeon]